MSIGGVHREDPATPTHALLKIADQRLYGAKLRGRNLAATSDDASADPGPGVREDYSGVRG